MMAHVPRSASQFNWEFSSIYVIYLWQQQFQRHKLPCIQREQFSLSWLWNLPNKWCVHCVLSKYSCWPRPYLSSELSGSYIFRTYGWGPQIELQWSKIQAAIHLLKDTLLYFQKIISSAYCAVSTFPRSRRNVLLKHISPQIFLTTHSFMLCNNCYVAFRYILINYLNYGKSTIVYPSERSLGSTRTLSNDRNNRV